MKKQIARIPEIDAALAEYAKENGKSWKRKLTGEDWPMCRPAGLLIKLRNSGWGFQYVQETKGEMV